MVRIKDGMKRIAVIVGHALKSSFCETIGRAYKAAAEEAGHEARIYVLSDMLFDPVLFEGFHKLQPLEPDLKVAHAAMFAADHLVFIFPLWLGDMPAILKGFLERILQPDLVEPARNGTFVKPLKGKSARVIITMGMPGLVYKWYFGANAAKLLKRNVLEFVGVSPVRTTLLANVEGVGERGRKAWIAEVEALGRSAF